MISVLVDGPLRDMRSILPEPVDLNCLLERVATGDRSALKSLYNLTASRLFAVLVRMVRRRELAEDLLQDVFLTVWCKAHQFDPMRGNAEAWLFSMTRRKAIDRLRISFREVTGLAEDVATLEPQSETYGRNYEVELKITINRCISDLNPDYKRALILCYKFGFTHEELALEMNVPVGTAKSWIRRGLTQLRDNFKDNDRR